MVSWGVGLFKEKMSKQGYYIFYDRQELSDAGFGFKDYQYKLVDARQWQEPWSEETSEQWEYLRTQSEKEKYE